MSVDATKWAWSLSMPATRKIVLLSMADRAGETHACWPSIARLEADTCLDRKTILAAIADLEKNGVISVSRSVGQGNCYQLIGVNDRETSTKNGTGTSPKNGTCPESAPVPKTGPVPNLGPVPKTGPNPSQKRDHHQSQKRDTEPTNEPTKNLNTNTKQPPALLVVPTEQKLSTGPTKAGAVCVVIKSEGIAQVNPSNPELTSLLEDGATVGQFSEAAKEAVQRQKGFGYVLAIVRRQVTEAANPITQAQPQHRSSRPILGETFRERDARLARERMEDLLPSIAAKAPRNRDVIDVTPVNTNTFGALA